MTEAERPIAAISWEGDSRSVLASFPDEVKGSVGFALYQLQRGFPPGIASRRMNSLGPGVFELKESDERGWYRVLYLSRIGDTIYVLHCFRKQSRRTSKRDLEIAAMRLAQVRRRILAEGAIAKRT